MTTFRSYCRNLSVLLAALVLSSPLVTQAQASADYPNRPVKIIVPVAPGGTVDMVARSIAEALTKSLGQQVIVENKPGASSLVGTNFVAKSTPDGYTLLAHSTTFVTARNLKDFIALAKAQPKFYAYASSGNGSTGHIAAELFSSAAGVSYLHVPYKGNAQSMVDLLGGQIPFMFDQVSTSAQYILTGKIAAIGVTSKTRSAILPNVPTLDESGLTGFEDSTFNGLFAPAGTPAPIINRLHTELTKILQSPELVKQFMTKGVELGASPTPEQFKQYLAQQTSRYQELARSAKITTD